MKNVFAVALVAAVGASASAANLYSTSFEAPTIAVGNLNGQDLWGNISNPSTLFQVANQPGFARTGTQFAFVNSAAAAAAGSQWSARPTVVAPVSAPNNIIRASVYTAVLNQTTTAVNRQTAGGIELFDDVGNFMGGIRIRNDGAIVLRNATGTATASTAPGAVTANAYNQVAIEADFGLQRSRFYINGIELDTSGLGATWASFSSTGFGDADLWVVRSNTGATNSGGHTVLFDDFSVDAIPTPGALSVLGFAGLVAARRRRA